jgi:hypothetical protein
MLATLIEQNPFLEHTKPMYSTVIWKEGGLGILSSTAFFLGDSSGICNFLQERLANEELWKRGCHVLSAYCRKDLS